MEKTKQKALDQVYQEFINTCMGAQGMDGLGLLVDENIFGFGSAFDEKIQGLDGVKRLLQNQIEQSSGIQITWKVEPLSRFISQDENTAVFADDICMTIHTGDQDVVMYLRLSTVINCVDTKWKVIHWHGSKPEEVESEKDTWGIENWKQKTEELERLVAEKTADLVEKNRELEIEAALERVRARALAMHSPEELPEVALELRKQMGLLGQEELEVCVIHLYEEHENYFESWGAMRAPGEEGKLFQGLAKFPKSGIAIVDEMMSHYHRGDKDYILVNEGGKAQEWFQVLKEYAPEIYQVLAETFENTPADQLKAYWAMSDFEGGSLGVVTYSLPGPDSLKLLRQSANVFQLAYRRYRDLQKAEALAREAQIEAALERVRARTMAMHNSEDVGQCVVKMFSELTALGVDEGTRFGIGILNHINENNQLWTARKNGDEVNLHIGNLDMTSHPLLKKARKAWKEQVPFHQYILEGQDLLDYYQMLNNAPEYKIHIPLEKLPKKEIQHCFIFEHGFFYAFSPREFKPELIQITQRFSLQFAQTYQRYLDLKKAEEQAREAQIEAALERVRSRSMGMQKSDELKEVIQVVFDQFASLNIHVDQTGFIMDYKERDDMYFWMTEKNQEPYQATVPYIDSAQSNSYVEAKKNNRDFFAVQLSFEEKNKFYRDLFSLFPAPDEKQAYYFNCPGLATSTVLLDSVGLFITNLSGVPYSSDENNTLMRFGKAFQQTYTRFLDLQKAEAQAREAQIEAALEKVRSRSLAMQDPAELTEVAQLLREEMGILGVEELETSSIYIHDENTGMTQCWFTIKDNQDPAKVISDQMNLDLQDTWVGREMQKFNQSSDNKTSIVMKGDQRVEWIRYCESKSELLGKAEFYGDSIPERTYHLFKFSNGFLGAASSGPISEESWDLMRRATSVFSFAFTRFLDLQGAQASAKAALRQASLDRVRADISSMRKAEDLDKITPLLFKELNILGIPFIRCGVFIIHEKDQIVEAYLSSPKGESLGALRLPFDASELTFQTVKAWRKQEVLRQHWDREDFVQWIKQIMEKDLIQDEKTYQGAAAPPESLFLNFIPFRQGMIYVGSTVSLSEDDIDLVKALSQSFAIAYSRYEDFVKLEQAKAEVESAMTELKATQAQLIQQEKLASLGQLTAGIAHEIKNPLNFVNNFSEVSLELVEEIQDIRRKTQDVNLNGEEDEILEDIKANLEKIHEHGSRANSIVTSMLQHSRGGSGKREPTDLNALIKEYVNLSFHGMRAGKNAINVEIALDLDEAINEVSLVKEDFTRVIVNLCNNAFDAMRGKTRQGIQDYHPKLTVSTNSEKDRIVISVKDNGPGIPDDIKDKILQPFFTTKKGTEGTGLGLSITHDIVKAHGGTLEVFSKQDFGSEFIINLYY